MSEAARTSVEKRTKSGRLTTRRPYELTTSEQHRMPSFTRGGVVCSHEPERVNGTASEEHLNLPRYSLLVTRSWALRRARCVREVCRMVRDAQISKPHTPSRHTGTEHRGERGSGRTQTTHTRAITGRPQQPKQPPQHPSTPPSHPSRPREMQTMATRATAPVYFFRS